MLPEALRGFQDSRLLILGVILIAVVRFYPAGLAGLVAGIARYAGRMRTRSAHPIGSAQEKGRSS
jgi:hypothetical protein